MPISDFTGENIETTYQRVVQTDGTLFADGTGSLISLSVGTLWEADAGGDVMPIAGSSVDQFWELDASLDIMPRA
jgi:hypothetical protein